MSVSTPRGCCPAATAGTTVAYDLLSTNSTPVAATPPLSGSEWFRGSGCCDVPTSQHRITLLTANGIWKKSELFAVDWSRVTNGELCNGGCTAPADFPFFGAPLLAVGHGVVVRAGDGRPDNPSTSPPPPAAAADPSATSFVVELHPGVCMRSTATSSRVRWATA